MTNTPPDPLSPYTGPININSWPLPAALPLDQALRELTDRAGYLVKDDDFDQVIADNPGLVQAWIAAAGRYSTADYLLRMLTRPIEWHRDEISRLQACDIEDLLPWVQNLHGCLTAYHQHLNERRDAYTTVQRACQALQREALLERSDRQWHTVELIAHGLTEIDRVEVPSTDIGPWPLVKVYEGTVITLAVADLQPAPEQPVVRRINNGFARLDHHGHATHLLPDPDGRYWLRDFTWTAAPEPEPATEHPDAANIPGA